MDLSFRSITPGGNEAFAAIYAVTEPVPAHRHDYYEIAFTMRGGGQHEDEAGRLPILSGDVWIVPPGRWHAYPRVNGELSIFNLMLTPEYVAALAPLRKLSTSPCPPHSFVGKEESTPAVTHLRLAPGALDRVGPLLSALAVELRQRPGYGQTCLCAGLILQILGLLERYGEAHRDPASTARGDAGLVTAIRYIEEHYAEPLTIHDLAQHSGYAPTSLARKFRHQIGMPPSDYILQLRLQHACTLLATTDLSIATIALNLGFSGSRYFAARFREVMGITPSTFRTQNQDRFTNTRARNVAS